MPNVRVTGPRVDTGKLKETKPRHKKRLARLRCTQSYARRGTRPVKSQVWRGHDKSSSRACLKSPCGEEPLPPPRSAGYTKVNVRRPPVSDSSRACGGVSAKSHASLQDNRLSNGILGKAPQSIFSAIFEDQLDSLSQILATLFGCASLPVSTGYLRTVGDEPFFVLLYDCGEFIVHSETSTSCPVVYVIIPEKSSTPRPFQRVTILPFSGGREREPAGRPTRPSVCNGGLAG